MFQPFEIVLSPEGPHTMRVFNADGSATETQLDAGAVNLVAVGSLEDDVLYEVENTGTKRADFMPSSRAAGSAPDLTKVTGKRLLPRGFMSVVTVKPVDQKAFWIWAPEYGPTTITVIEAPQ